MTDGRRLLAGTRGDGAALTLHEHLTVHGALPLPRRGEAKHLQHHLQGAGLRGRGGAGFPAARKLAAAHESGRNALLIANGAEGEPASLKDRTLLQLTPHLVLDGLQLAARAVNAREVVLAVHSGGPLPGVVTRALAERTGRGERDVRLLEVPNRYVSGEASALARAAGGGPSLPALHDQPLAVRGLDRRPTVVLNVETLAGLALYLRKGPSWYGEVGTAEEPGTLLLTVRGDGAEPVVLEAPLGTSVRTVLDTAGVPTADLQAVLVGGYFGAWLPAPDVLDVPLSIAGLAQAGGTLGAGIVIALPSSACGLRATAGAVRYLAAESARQCGPCLNGLPAIAGALDQLVAGEPPPGTLDKIAAWSGLVSGRGLCHHPDGVVALVRSALHVFAEDVQEHLHGDCRRTAGRVLAVPRGTW